MLVVYTVFVENQKLLKQRNKESKGAKHNFKNYIYLKIIVTSCLSKNMQICNQFGYQKTDDAENIKINQGFKTLPEDVYTSVSAVFRWCRNWEPSIYVETQGLMHFLLK